MSAALMTPERQMRELLQLIATGPEYSKPLSRDQARIGMTLILDGAVDPVQAGVFLIALRMKRETDDENLGILDALQAATRVVTAPVDSLVDIADPYDGFTRGLPSSPFLPAVLAACGIPAVSHGVEAVGPKFGISHRQVLRAAGAPVDLTPEAAASRLADPDCGWAYVDQAQFCPKLYALTGLRKLIVKRPALTTIENLLGPIRARHHTHLVTGYVHTAYPRVYELLGRAAGFDSALIVRGVEGGVTPSLRQTGRMFYYRDQNEAQNYELDPPSLGVDQPVRAAPLPEGIELNAFSDDNTRQSAAQAAADAGLAALKGESGPARDGLILGAALCLWHLGRYHDPQSAAGAVREVLDSGQALACFKH